jgi:hypothetical protein
LHGPGKAGLSRHPGSTPGWGVNFKKEIVSEKIMDRKYTAKEAAAFASWYHQLIGEQIGLDTIERMKNREDIDLQDYARVLDDRIRMYWSLLNSYISEVPSDVRRNLRINTSKIERMLKEKRKGLQRLVKEKDISL